jgi:hypothetical protein
MAPSFIRPFSNLERSIVPGLAAWLLIVSTRFPEVFAEVFRDPAGTTFLCFLFFVLEAA